MSTPNTHNLSFNGLEQGKSKHFTAQLQKVYQALKESPMTMKEADVYTGVMRENICRYIDILFDQNRIAVIRQRKCKITGYPYVNEYTTDPDLFPQSNQLNLF
jgi:hypothetical protein